MSFEDQNTSSSQGFFVAAILLQTLYSRRLTSFDARLRMGGAASEKEFCNIIQIYLLYGVIFVHDING